MMTSVIILLLCISYPVLANGPFIDEPPQYITGRFMGDTVQFNCSINSTDDYPELFVRVGSTVIQPDDNYSGVVYHRSSPDTITVNVTITNNNHWTRSYMCNSYSYLDGRTVHYWNCRILG